MYVGARLSSSAPTTFVRPAIGVVLLASGLKLVDATNAEMGIGVVVAVALVLATGWWRRRRTRGAGAGPGERRAHCHLRGPTAPEGADRT